VPSSYLPEMPKLLWVNAFAQNNSQHFLKWLSNDHKCRSYENLLVLLNIGMFVDGSAILVDY
jgi:hypothetical protein